MPRQERSEGIAGRTDSEALRLSPSRCSVALMEDEVELNDADYLSIRRDEVVHLLRLGMVALRERLRTVQVVCGDWRRVLTTACRSVTRRGRPTRHARGPLE